MNITDLITDRVHENINPRDINTIEGFRWIIEMIAIEYHKEQLALTDVSQQRELLLGFQKSEWFDLYEQGVLSYKDAIEKYLA